MSVAGVDTVKSLSELSNAIVHIGETVDVLTAATYTQSEAEVITPDDDYMMTHQQANVFFTMNALFGSLFVICFASTIAVIIRREISDIFLKLAMACMIVALALSAIMCFILASYESEEYLTEQSVPFQQVYFEVPFYFFLVVIASILFSWQQAYELYELHC